MRFGQVDAPWLRSQDEGRWLPRPAWLKRLHRFLQVWVWGLHLNCSGTGSPIVLVYNGAGGFSVEWALMQPAIAKRTRVCTYDRAGYAWSNARR